MRHTLTLVIGMCLGRLLNRALDIKDYEIVIIIGILSLAVGILIHKLFKSEK